MPDENLDVREQLWKAFTTIEDAYGTGFRSGRGVPDFSCIPDASSSSTGDVQSGTMLWPEAAGGDTLESIEREVVSCFKCRLSAGRKKTVFGAGTQSPSLLLIGEGPGAEEDASGIPFVGPAGQLLDRMLAAIGLSREKDCYIGNIVKCRPPMNRDPAPDEQSACIGYLMRQIAILKPKAILTLGRISTQALLGVKDGITKLRGRVYAFRGIPLVPTYHPSALLRDENLKRPAWEDLKTVRGILS